MTLAGSGDESQPFDSRKVGRLYVVSLESSLGLVNEVPMPVKSVSSSEEPLMVEVHVVVPPVVSEKNIAGVEAIFCIAEQAEIG